MPSTNLPVKYYFVDEAGDTTLFNRRGRLLVGTEGVSRTIMVGICELSSPDDADLRLSELRQQLLSDPYFRGVPSMSVAARKTALSFHAKDDIPEVRREVFRVISQLRPKIFVAQGRRDSLSFRATRKVLTKRSYECSAFSR